MAYLLLLVYIFVEAVYFRDRCLQFSRTRQKMLHATQWYTDAAITFEREC